MNRRAFLTRASLVAGSGLAAAGYGRWVERHRLEVVSVVLRIGTPSPVRVAVIADLHFDPLYEDVYLEEVVETINGLAPDVMVYLGDFVSRSSTRLSDLSRILGRCRARLGSYAVLGNHDHWVDPDGVTAALTASGIVVLRNRSVPFPDQRDWYITGLESFWAGVPNPWSAAETPPDARHLLLVHEPDSFDALSDRRFALQLSGHTHGGQVRVPLLGAIKLPRWGRKYQAGLYAQGARQLYVNRGIGTVGDHVRVNCRPEITLLTLT